MASEEKKVYVAEDLISGFREMEKSADELKEKHRRELKELAKKESDRQLEIVSGMTREELFRAATLTKNIIERMAIMSAISMKEQTEL